MNLDPYGHHAHGAPGLWDHGLTWRTEIVTDADDFLINAADVSAKVLRVQNDGFDEDLIAEYIAAAVVAAEEQTGRTIAPRTLALILDRFPLNGTGPIVLPGAPLRAVTSVTYTDADGNTQELLTSPSIVRTLQSGARVRARLVPEYGEVWPVTRCELDAVRIEYTAGYLTADAIPADVRTGIYLFIDELYRIRGLSIQGVNTSVPTQLPLERFWKRMPVS
jgi:uncharacterized phiE125 gp8 family phage protein